MGYFIAFAVKVRRDTEDDEKTRPCRAKQQVTTMRPRGLLRRRKTKSNLAVDTTKATTRATTKANTRSSLLSMA